MPAVTMTVKDMDRGWQALFRELTKDSPKGVVVGVLGEAAHKAHDDDGESDGTTVLDVAIWNEFGTSRIPSRSFLRDTFAIHRDDILNRMRTEFIDVISGKQTKERAFARIGLYVEGLVKERIAAGVPPPNAQSTIDQKGSDKPLIDSGQLRSSIASEVR